MGKFFFWLMKIMGWKIDEHIPAGVKKAVIVVGPHTSNWDFVIGRIAFMKYNMKAKYLIKKELFFFPFGYFLKAIGGIPVDRTKKNNITEQAVKLFKENDEFFLVFSPEGTRKYQPHWKKGFYYIARQANVPIYITYIDYKTKRGGFDTLFTPTGDFEKDIKEIKRILSKYSGRFPENGIFAED
jgi:1-acyl-sn-glycerol-3-phosphate acyltransferase